MKSTPTTASRGSTSSNAVRRSAAAAREELTVNAVARAVTILKYLSRSDIPIGASRLARELELNPSTCFNILRTLRKEGLVAFDEAAKTYAIGMGLVSMTKHIMDKDRDVASFRPALERIAREHGVTACLMHRITDDRMVALIVCMSSAPVRIHMSVGQRMPLLTGSAGRLMAAFSEFEPGALRRQFDQVRWGRPISFQAFQSQVEQVRKVGWAIDEGNFVPGAVTVAVPVFDEHHRVRYACSALMFSGQRKKQAIARLVSDLLLLTRAGGRVNSRNEADAS